MLGSATVNGIDAEMPWYVLKMTTFAQRACEPFGQMLSFSGHIMAFRSDCWHIFGISVEQNCRKSGTLQLRFFYLTAKCGAPRPHPHHRSTAHGLKPITFNATGLDPAPPIFLTFSNPFGRYFRPSKLPFRWPEVCPDITYIKNEYIPIALFGKLWVMGPWMSSKLPTSPTAPYDCALWTNLVNLMIFHVISVSIPFSPKFSIWGQRC